MNTRKDKDEAAKEDMTAGMTVASATNLTPTVRIRAIVDEAWHSTGRLRKGEEADVSPEDAKLLIELGHCERVKA
jgi:hypothetical protein